MGSNFTGQQIQLTEKGTSWIPSLLRPEVLLCRLCQSVSLLSEITALKVPLHSSALLAKGRTCKTKAAAHAFTLQISE